MYEGPDFPPRRNTEIYVAAAMFARRAHAASFRDFWYGRIVLKNSLV
jgi:hypothetical protein